MDDEIKRSRNIGGNNPLLILRDFFSINIKIPNSVRSSNEQENQGQRGATKTRKLQVSLQIRNKKDRNNLNRVSK